MKRVADVTREVEFVAREVKGYCSAGIKVGDKVTFRGANIVKEKSGPICGFAVAGLYPVIFAVRMGVDLDEIVGKDRLWQCADPGQPYTPGGTVLFEVRPVKPE